MPHSGPILVAQLFPEISQHLVDLLRSLSCEDWHRPTVSFTAKCKRYRQPSARRQYSAPVDAA